MNSNSPYHRINLYLYGCYQGWHHHIWHTTYSQRGIWNAVIELAMVSDHPNTYAVARAIDAYNE